MWFALGEIARDELKEVDKARVARSTRRSTLDCRFIEAFSALEAMLGKDKQWKPLEENYARMIQRLPKTDDTHAARMALWRALGDLYLQVLKQPEARGDGLQGGGDGAAGGRAGAGDLRRAGGAAAGLRGAARSRRYRRALPRDHEPGQGGVGAGRAGGEAEGLRLGVAGGAGGVGADRRRRGRASRRSSPS